MPCSPSRCVFVVCVIERAGVRRRARPAPPRARRQRRASFFSLRMRRAGRLFVGRYSNRRPDGSTRLKIVDSNRFKWTDPLTRPRTRALQPQLANATQQPQPASATSACHLCCHLCHPRLPPLPPPTTPTTLYHLCRGVSFCAWFEHHGWSLFLLCLVNPIVSRRTQTFFLKSFQETIRWSVNYFSLSFFFRVLACLFQDCLRL